jgi:hypothetical protein
VWLLTVSTRVCHTKPHDSEAAEISTRFSFWLWSVVVQQLHPECTHESRCSYTLPWHNVDNKGVCSCICSRLPVHMPHSVREHVRWSATAKALRTKLYKLHMTRGIGTCGGCCLSAGMKITPGSGIGKAIEYCHCQAGWTLCWSFCFYHFCGYVPGLSHPTSGLS